MSDNKPKISESVRADLREHLVREVTIDAAEIMLGHVIDAAETVAREYDPDIGDDPNLAGMIVSRRGKNVAAADLRSRQIPEVVVRPVRGFTWEINAGGTRLHTYSAPGGLDGFQLVGGDRKAEIVERSMEQLSLFAKSGNKSQPGDLVLAYVRNHRGVQRATLGVMKSEVEFAWQVPIYNADGLGEAATPERPPKPGPSFREQPEKQADISLRTEEGDRDQSENL